MVLDWACPDERSEQRICCCPWIEARGEEKQRQTQNNPALHCGEGERHSRMEHMSNSSTGSKQPPAVEGGCPGLVLLLARRDLTNSSCQRSVFKAISCSEHIISSLEYNFAGNFSSQENFSCVMQFLISLLSRCTG